MRGGLEVTPGPSWGSGHYEPLNSKGRTSYEAHLRMLSPSMGNPFGEGRPAGTLPAQNVLLLARPRSPCEQL